MSIIHHPDLDPVPGGGGPVLSEADNERAVDLIETAGRETPFCVCGEATAPVSHGDTVWLECPTLHQPRRGLARLLAWADVWHTSRVIVELSS